MSAGGHLKARKPIHSAAPAALTARQFSAAVRAGENGGFVSLAVMRALPRATDAEITAEVNRVYDAMEYPEPPGKGGVC
jgi:hypothetical protein